jgi:hypothetical protein
MKIRYYLISVVLSIFFGFFILNILEQGYDNIMVRYPNREEVQNQVNYLNDSTNDEYFRKNTENKNYNTLLTVDCWMKMVMR